MLLTTFLMSRKKTEEDKVGMANKNIILLVLN